MTRTVCPPPFVVDRTRSDPVGRVRGRKPCRMSKLVFDRFIGNADISAISRYKIFVVFLECNNGNCSFLMWSEQKSNQTQSKIRLAKFKRFHLHIRSGPAGLVITKNSPIDAFLVYLYSFSFVFVVCIFHIGKI